MRGEGTFILVTILNLYLSIIACSFNCREVGCLTQRVDTLVHTWKLVRVSFNNIVEFAIVDAKSKSSVFSEDEHCGGCPSDLCRVNDVFGSHYLFIGHFKFSSFYTSVILGRVYRRSTCHRKLYAAFCSGGAYQETIPRGLKF